MGQRLSVLCILATTVLVPARAQVQLKARTVAGPADLRTTPVVRKTPHRSHILVAMDAMPTTAVMQIWEQRGIRVVGHIPPRSVMLSTPDGVDLRVPGLRWSGRLSAEDKISALVGSDDDAAGAYVVEFYPDVDMALARELVTETGMQTQAHSDLVQNQLLVLGTTGQIAGLASWDEVSYVFPASADLVAGNHVLSCAGAMSDAGLIGQYVKVSTGWTGNAQGVALSYVFTALTPKLPASTVQSEVNRAFSEWARYAPLIFQPGTSATAPRTIAIQFASGQHGDGYNFDGPGGTLAHTFYPAPPNMEPLAGDMHFDADEAWDNPQKIDLYSVALHEAGHALGLGHSDKPGAVMYPYYRLSAYLADDDIAGIRAIYAAPAATPQPAALVVSVISPNASSTSVTTSSIAMSGTATGGTGAPQVTWTSNQGTFGKASGSSVWNIPVVPLNLGTNIITVTAVDDAGTIASRVVTVTRLASSGNPPPGNPGSPPPNPPPPANPTTPSGSPPALKITSPGFTIISTSAASIAISGTASADVTQVTWNNSSGASGVGTGTSSWSATVPLLTGTNTITIRAYNAAGSSWRSLTVVRR
jgi:hypothetical protein